MPKNPAGFGIPCCQTRPFHTEVEDRLFHCQEQAELNTTFGSLIYEQKVRACNSQALEEWNDLHAFIPEVSSSLFNVCLIE